MKIIKEFKVTEAYLNANPNVIFIFGDNFKRRGYGGAAKLRDHPQSYGFITKKYPSLSSWAYYNEADYGYIFKRECEKLIVLIHNNSNKTILISKLGAGLANKYNIFENIIQLKLPELLKNFKNVTLLWN